MPRCATCKRPFKRVTYGYCPTCYERAVKSRGELALVVQDEGDRPYTLEHASADTVHAYFQATDPSTGEVHAGGRRWCLVITYTDGFPCPPTLRFVNPYDHADENPLWWPRTTFATDPIRQVFDLPFVSLRSAARAHVNHDVQPGVLKKEWLPDRVVTYIARRVRDSLL